MHRWGRIAAHLWGISLVWANAGVVRAENFCGTDPLSWSQALTTNLPLYSNLELVRSGGRYRVVLVSLPEVVSLSQDEVQHLGLEPNQTEMVLLYFSTLERRLMQGADPEVPASDDFLGRRTQELRLAYQGYVARERVPEAPWQLLSLSVKGPGNPPRDISEGAIAQAIRAWQEGGCLARYPQPLSR
ncbi:MAG: hypothetical protein HC921_01765 [Synechococcaceae cyanobacterium SM2_3_1]|nr:hypothetical protein [Synechococcaceae cyanobacterium SM2_3_1]